MEKNEAIIVDPKKFGLDEITASKMTKGLDQIIKERDEMIPQYDAIIKMDIDDPVTVQLAYDHLQLIKKNRTKGIQVWHKNNKEFYLRGGQFVDAINRRELSINERMEENLSSIVKHNEIKETKRKAELKTARLELLAAYPECNTQFFNLEEMDGATFGNLLKQLAKDKVDKEIADKKAKEEEDRIAKEKKELADAEAKKLKAENDKLLAEKIEREQKEEAEKIEKIKKADKFVEILTESGYRNLGPALFGKSASKSSIPLTVTYETLKHLTEDEFNERIKEVDDKIDKELELAAEKAIADAEKLAAEKRAAAAEKELADKKAAEDKIAADKIAAEKTEAENKRKAALAPVKDQLKSWVKAVVVPGIDQTKFNDPAKKVSLEIMAKHEAWKAWADVEINKLN